MGMNDSFEKPPLLGSIQLQNAQRGKNKEQFVFLPTATMCGVHFASQSGQRFVCTLIGHWLLDCSKRYLTFVDKKIFEQNFLKNLQDFVFLCPNEQRGMLQKFHELLQDYPALTCGT